VGHRRFDAILLHLVLLVGREKLRLVRPEVHGAVALRVAPWYVPMAPEAAADVVHVEPTIVVVAAEDVLQGQDHLKDFALRTDAQVRPVLLHGLHHLRALGAVQHRPLRRPRDALQPPLLRHLVNVIGRCQGLHLHARADVLHDRLSACLSCR
jgi:hypothetical protein